MAQQLAIQLAASLGDARVNMRLLQVRPEETEDMIRAEIGRMAVMLDILQLRYCDCADEELAFLDELAECTEA